MTNREMFEKSFLRPGYFFELDEDQQWEIDKALGILDWVASDLSTKDIDRYVAHYTP